ncbi:MAG: hypothetical protein FD141_392 [Fusobacteria bacterium]|nr:MAG: hypothetical protein FD141_392 [Fusobacteriota bacterium]KAF0228943.1 MAG: hypothetical protein FD182_1199 [Fusobacteriota bacterium]
MRIPNPPFNDKRYVLNTNTGVAHDLDNYCASCLIYNMNHDHVFASDYFYSEIKSHPAFKELCDHCMTPDG